MSFSLVTQAGSDPKSILEIVFERFSVLIITHSEAVL
jgi:hypothetical protein